MCEENKRAVCFVLSVCIVLAGVLCGCTRKEQLILDAGDGERRVQEAGWTGTAGAEEEDAVDASEGARSGRNVPEEEQDGADPSEPDGDALICVHVCGAVRNAGVYEMPAGSRVFEAVELAGGFTEEADESYVNQAQQLADGIKLVIPTTEQVRFLQEGAAGDESEVDTAGQAEANPAAEYGVLDGQEEILDDTASSADGKININTATKEQLCEIPGIGATRAAAIEAYRQQAGSFASIEDIMKVSGIKEGTYAKIKDYIKVK